MWYRSKRRTLSEKHIRIKVKCTLCGTVRGSSNPKNSTPLENIIIRCKTCCFETVHTLISKNVTG